MRALEFVKASLQIEINNSQLEEQNKDYEGAIFHVGKTSYRSRLAKKTPKKEGYFVVFWKKDSNDNNCPYSYRESPDYVIVSVIDNEKKGLFLFPKCILKEKGILSDQTSKGKMAIRVYPDWSTNLNENALKTQAWQLVYFKNYS